MGVGVSKRWREQVLRNETWTEEQFWRELHELAESTKLQCNGQWYMKRAEIAEALHRYAEVFARQWAKKKEMA